MVFVYPDDDIGSHLISLPVNTSGTTQAFSEAQMKSKFKLEMANVTMTSQLIKNSTTNKYKRKSINKDGSVDSSLQCSAHFLFYTPNARPVLNSVKDPFVRN